MYEDPKSKISQLEKVLDARDDRVSKKVKRHELHDHESNIPRDWDDTEFEKKSEPLEIKGVGLEVSSNPNFSGTNINLADKLEKDISFPWKVLLGSIIFFIIAIFFVVFKFWVGGNIVSGDNIEVTIKAPVSIAGGEVLPFEIEVRNNNSITLTGVDLGIVFPTGAVQYDNVALPLKRSQIFLGDINPGQNVKKNFKVVVFGAENERKNIDLTLEYKVAGSNSQFNKTKSVPILITSAPVSLVISSPSEINTNQGVNFTVDVTSNSTSIIKNLLLKADYPFGFSFVSSDPATFSKNNLWLLGDLNPGERRTIKIFGLVSGQEGEERGFNFSLGAQSSSDTMMIETPFNSSFSSVLIRRPFVSADVLFNGQNTSEYVTNAGDKIEGVVRWQNNLAYQVSDVSIVLKISGNAIDKSGIQVDGGFYRSLDNTITFDKTTDKIFVSLEPGQSGESKFSLKSFNPSSVTGAGLSNPTIYLAVSVQGKTIETNGSIKNVLFTDSRKIKVTSNPRLFAKSLYYIGPFQNTGPIPAKSEKETTYTVTWTVTNPLNNLSGARVVATLPPYIKWLENVSPSSEKISYDPNTRQIAWNIGNVSAGAGTVSAAREVSFQISLLPSVSQIGSAPELVNEATLTARDSFTATTVSSTFQAVTTRLSNDPYFNISAENVVQ